MSTSLHRGQLSTLDSVFRAADRPRRPADFTLLLHLDRAPDIEGLREGARSARDLYPTTGSTIDGKQWVRSAEPEPGVTIFDPADGATVDEAVEAFIDSPFDPRHQAPVKQLVIVDGTGGAARLVTRFHHAAADYLSAMMWLGHQLGVAFGREDRVAGVSPFRELRLRSHSSPTKRSKFSHKRPADRLWHSGARSSRARGWHTLEIPCAEMRDRCYKVGGFTYNDLLATCALEVLVRWNRSHTVNRGQNVGLLLPVNIRQQSFEGFGNGASRIRLYARSADNASLVDMCRGTRRQVDWCKQHGEWAVPRSHPFIQLPAWAGYPLLRRYLDRPWVDVATSVFSHAERWSGQNSEIFQNVSRIEFIGLLHARHSLAINCATLRDRTWITFTYDPGLMTADDVKCLSDMYHEQLDRARREFK